MSLYQYGSGFFAYQKIGSLTSARAVVPLVLDQLRISSVLDVGCGAGAWLSAYDGCGVRDALGVDAGYLSADQLLFDPAKFHVADVGRPFWLGRSFDLVQCLEVAEHLDAAKSEQLIENLAVHAPMALFSSAPPGQGGEHHVNERPYEYWRDLFDQRGYDLFDFVRPQLRGRADIEPWYRYNSFLYVRRDIAPHLPAAVAVTRVPRGTPIADVAPLPFRLRRRVLSKLPEPVLTHLAWLKHRFVLLRSACA